MKKGLGLFLFIFSITAVAQDSLSFELPESDLGENPQDSILVKAIIPAFYFDYGKLFTMRSNFEKKYEGAFEVIIKDKWQVITEMGFSKLTPQSAFENGEYVSRGNYYRFGFGFVPHRDVGSRIGISMRYAHSSFSDKGNYLINSPSQLQPDTEENFHRINLSATWWEAVVYSDLAMNDWLTVGFNFRVRFMKEYDQFEEIDVVSIPGYGRAQDKNVPAINLFLKFTPF